MSARGEADGLGPANRLIELAAGGRCAITLDPGGRRAAYQGIVPLASYTFGRDATEQALADRGSPAG